MIRIGTMGTHVATHLVGNLYLNGEPFTPDNPLIYKTENDSLFVGIGVGDKSTQRSGNIALGIDSMTSIGENSNDNIAIGRYTLKGMSYGNNNIAIGTYAGQSLTGGSNNIYIGSYVDCEDSYEYETIRIGNPDHHSITYLINPHAYINGVFYKIHADNFRITGSNEILIGKGIGTTGISEGGSNIVIGNNSATRTAANGYRNVIIGEESYLSNTGQLNVAIGYRVGPSSGSVENTYTTV